MPVQLDHTIIWARDSRPSREKGRPNASTELLAMIVLSRSKKAASAMAGETMARVPANHPTVFVVP